MKENRFSFLYLGIFLIIGACIAIAGYQYHKNFERHFRANVENQLRLIADLKVGELEHWLGVQRGNAETLFGNEVFANIIKRYLNNPNDRDAKREIQVWLKEFQTGFNYDAVLLTDPQLIKKIVIPEATERPRAYISPGNIDSLREGKLVFEDFYRDEVKQKIFLKILIPILDVKKLIGIIELRIDPRTYIYPLLNNWPIPSETSETLILKNEGNQAVYLNELRFHKNSALNLRIPLEDTSIPAVRALLGYTGFMEGIDYRGKAVVAYVAKVSNSPWYLVVKVDDSEVYAPLRKDLLETVIFAFVMGLIAVMGLGFIWRHQRTLVYKEKIKSADALQKLNLAIYNSQEVVFLTDIEGTITYINPEFTKIYGYTAEEVVGVTTPKVLNSGLNKKVDSKLLWDALLDKQTIPKTEYFNKCKDGKLIDIEGSAAPIIDHSGNIIGFLGIQRDISERKRSELEQLAMYEITRGVTTTNNLNELLKSIHQSLAKVIYADNYFVALHDQNTGLFSFPYYVDQFDTTPEPVEMPKSCTAYVFRTGKPLLITPKLFQQLKEQNEVELVGSPSPSWVGVPLQTPTKTIGVLVLQNYEKENVYSERDVQFLDSVGSQIAMAIERKQAEEDLRNERLLLRTVIDNIPDSIYCKDIFGRKTLANLTELSYSGANSEADILGKTDFDLYPKELAEGFFADDQIVLQTDRPVLNREEYLIDANGHKHWLLTSKLPMKDEYGNITGLVGIGRDITLRRQAEDELRESKETFRVHIENSFDVIFTVNTEGVFIFVSPAWERHFGHPTSEVTGKSFVPFVHPDDVAPLFEYLKRVLGTGQSETSPAFRVKHVDGRWLWFMCNGTPYFDIHGEQQFIGVGHDITERLRTVQEIKLKNEELQKINAEKDKFFSIIAHDLRSPFNGFLGLTQIMAEELPSLTMAQVQDLAITMKNSATNLFNLLENLLEWAQMQRGSISFTPEVVQLQPMVDECVAIALEPARNKGIDITCHIPDSTEVFADMHMLQTVIRNLVSNAIKFTPIGGKISLSAKETSDQSVEISIRDTGIGMNQEMVDNLFRPDVQTSRKGTEGELSTGLGLMLCKEFIEKHGGRIWIESEEGKGSIFRFLILGKRI